MSTFALKLIAVISMTIDHTGAVLFPYETWMRYVGRIAFPVYAFLIVEGYVHTSDVKKYLMRLGLFAVISEVPFDLAFNTSFFSMDCQNVYFTLFFGLLALILIDVFSGQIFWQTLSVLCMCLAAAELTTDYRYLGVIVIILFYVFRDRPFMKAVTVTLALSYLSGPMEFFGSLALIPIFLYNGELGRHKWKYFFYVFYPVHLMILVCIRKAVTGSWLY